MTVSDLTNAYTMLLSKGFSSDQATCLIGLQSQIQFGIRTEYPAQRPIRTTPDLRGIERLPQRPRPVGLHGQGPAVYRGTVGKKRQPPKGAVTGVDLLCAGLLVAGVYVVMIAAWGLR